MNNMENADYIQIIGKNIRKKRQSLGITIDELSKVLNIAPGFLGLIERGKRGASIKNLCKIANFFDISLDDFILKTINDEDNELVLSDDDILLKSINLYLSSMDTKKLELSLALIKGVSKL